MAFSTQKDFFHVPFMDETVDYGCSKACVKLKTYQSTSDNRSWAINETEQSRFLSDLINCQTPVRSYDDDSEQRDGYSSRRGIGRGDQQPGGGGRGGADRRVGGPHSEKITNDIGYVAGAGYERGGEGPSDGGQGGRRGISPSGGVSGGTRGGDGGGGFTTGGYGAAGRSAQGGLATADSVIARATEQLGRIEELISHKKNLENKLDVSNERLRILNMENEKIKEIMNEKFDSNHAKDFYNKIQKLTSSGKISKGEENELLHIYNKFEDMNKAYEILQAENAYLKRLIEKLSLRASYESIKIEPERNTDIGFLQKEINKLRQEVKMLRKFEDTKLKGTIDSNRKKMTDQDADAIKTIIKERDALREKCKTVRNLEGKVAELQKCVRDADEVSDSLSNELDNQTKRIGELEYQMKGMQEYYENLISKSKYNEELLKRQLAEMKEDLVRAKCCSEKAKCLQMEISCLRNELLRRDMELRDYDCQVKQMMNVIDELQGNAIQNRHDTPNQICTDYMDDLTFFARATISEIKKELKRRGADGDGIRDGGGSGFFDGPAITDGLSSDECCAEMRRLQDIIRRLTKENEYLQNNVKNAAEDLCADTLKKMKELEERCKDAQSEISTLKQDKDDLNMNTMKKLNEFSERVDKLDTDVVRTANDTAGMDKDLKESMRLVQDISDMQLRNARLTNVVNAITARDDQRVVDDLRRLLLEEQDKNKKCQEDNKNLREALVKRGIDPNLVVKEIVKEIKPQKDVVQDDDRGGQADTGPGKVGGSKAGQISSEPDGHTFGGKDSAKTGRAVVGEVFTPDTAKISAPDGSKVGETDAAKKGEVSKTPDAVKKDGAGAADKGKPDSLDARGPSPGEVFRLESAQKDKTELSSNATDIPGVTKTGGAGPDEISKPETVKKDEVGPSEAIDGGKTGSDGSSKTGGPDAAKKDEVRPGQTTTPDDSKTGGATPLEITPGAAKKEEPAQAESGKQGPAKAEKPDATKKGGPVAAEVKKRGEDEIQAPGAGATGSPDVAKKDGLGAGATDKPGAAKKDGPGASATDKPVAAKKDEPGEGATDKPGAAKKDGPGEGTTDKPGAAKKDEPDAGVTGAPDAASKYGPDMGVAGGPDSGEKDGPIAGVTGGEEIARLDAPLAGKPAGTPSDNGRFEPGATGPGAIDKSVYDGSGASGQRAVDPTTADAAARDPNDGVGGASAFDPGTSDTTTRGPAAGRTGVSGPDSRALEEFVTGDQTAPVKGIAETRSGVGGGPDTVPGKIQPGRGGPSSVVGKAHLAKGADGGPADDAFQRFVDSNANTMMINIKSGSALEKELTAILNAFMMECGFCFCKSRIPKSKFYALCHKLLHNGIQSMAFRELAYMHRKIFMAADKLHPGCLINMILTEQGFKDGDGFKCCHCKNALCCSNSEEMFKEKLCKLEEDIEIVKHYLDSVKAYPKTPKSPYTPHGKTYRQMEDNYSEAVEELLTCRETKPVLSKLQSKQIKTLKARIIKYPELLR